jgi:hypothetical protein
MPFCTLFKEIQESTPYICTSDKCNNFVCVNMYYVMHMTRGPQKLKFGETYAKSVKTEQSDLGNRIIWFCQQNHKSWNIHFFRLNILIRKHTPMISRHSNIHICINKK